MFTFRCLLCSRCAFCCVHAALFAMITSRCLLCSRCAVCTVYVPLFAVFTLCSLFVNWRSLFAVSRVQCVALRSPPPGRREG